MRATDWNRAGLAMASVMMLLQVGCTEFTGYNNKGDPRVIHAVTPKKTQVTYFGTRNADGIPTKINAVRVSQVGKQLTDIELDDQSRPIRITLEDGVVMAIQWLSDTNFVVRFLSPDRTVQVQIPYDTTTGKVGKVTARKQVKAADKGTASAVTVDRSARAGKKLSAKFNPAQAGQLVPIPESVGSGNAVVNVTGCNGEPVNDATVSVTYTAVLNGISGETFSAIATPQGAGQYITPIPLQGETIGDDVEDICKACASPLNTLCDGLGTIPPGSEIQICTAIGVALDAINVPSGEAVVYIAACESGFAAARTYCETLGASPGPGAPSVADFICENMSEVVDAANVLDNVLLIAQAQRGGESAESGIANMPPNGPVPSLSVALNGTVEVENFVTDPVDPAPQEGYVAVANIRCAPTDTSVTLTIVGTDGYTDSTTISVTGTGTISLYVPGASEGVLDTLTVDVTGGPSVTVAVVF